MGMALPFHWDKMAEYQSKEDDYLVLNSNGICLARFGFVGGYIMLFYFQFLHFGIYVPSLYCEHIQLTCFTELQLEIAPMINDTSF